MRFDTKVVHVGQEPSPPAGDVVTPIHVAVTYDREAQDPLRYFYGRGENPTREALERCLASLEDARFATAFSSGQAAATTATSLAAPGRRLIASDDLYGGTYLLLNSLRQHGVAVSYVDLTDLMALDRAWADDVAMVWIETPTNPLLKIVDVQAVSQKAAPTGAIVVVDNTLAGPAAQQPLRLGANMSLYSTTKSLAGHSDTLGGALVYDDPELHRTLTAYRGIAGNVPGPFDCFLTHRGLQSYALRHARQVSNARALAQALDGHARVGLVRYPGLVAHPQRALAAQQMLGPGSIVSFEYLGDPEKFMRRLRLFAGAVSLGGVRSLVECPALMTHAPVPRDVRLRLGITDRLIRLAAGVEDPADLVDDLLSALADG